MTQLFTNNAATTTVGAITNVATSITVSDGSKFPAPVAPDFSLLTLIGLDGNGNENAWEVVKLTGRTANVLTIVRAQEGTAAVAWADATRIELRLTAAGMAAKLDADLSTLTDADALDGTELVPVNKTGAKRTTVQKILDWIKTQAITWAAKQTFSAGIDTPAATHLPILTQGVEKMRVTAAGFVGIGTTAPAVNFEVSAGGIATIRANRGTSGAGQRTDTYIANDGTYGAVQTWSDALGAAIPLKLNPSGGNVETQGFSRLGESSPAIKVKKLTGTTSSVADGSSSVAHGLNAAKILSVTGHVNSTLGQELPFSFTRDGGAQMVEIFFDGSNVTTINGSSATSNVFSRPFTAFITYEE